MLNKLQDRFLILCKLLNDRRHHCLLTKASKMYCPKLLCINYYFFYWNCFIFHFNPSFIWNISETINPSYNKLVSMLAYFLWIYKKKRIDFKKNNFDRVRFLGTPCFVVYFSYVVMFDLDMPIQSDQGDTEIHPVYIIFK